DVGSQQMKSLGQAFFEKDDGQRIRFFSRGARRAPDANDVFAAAAAANVRQHFPANELKLRRLAEEVSLADRYIDDQIVERFLTSGDEGPVLVHVRNPRPAHRPANALLDWAITIRRESQSGSFGQHVGHCFVGGLGPAHDCPSLPSLVGAADSRPAEALSSKLESSERRSPIGTIPSGSTATSRAESASERTPAASSMALPSARASSTARSIRIATRSSPVQPTIR